MRYIRFFCVFCLICVFSKSAEITHNLEQKIEKSDAEMLRVWLFFDENYSAESLAPITDFGFQQRRISRYFNAISGDISPDSIFHFITDEHIDSIDIVHSFYRPKPPESPKSPMKISETDYGASFAQLQRMGIPEIHNAGFRGESIKIAIFDTGFNPNHLAFQNVNILAQRDFVQNDLNTQNEFGDVSDQDNHGTAIMGILAANLPGVLVGVAPGAEYIIAKTEKVDEEIIAEEDNWIAAVEWADSLGADIISSSLAYLEFDDGFAYDYSDLNGVTTRIAIAANIAGERGINVVTAAGNFGSELGSIWTPADALPPALAIGAVDENGIIADFSSRGPTADGRIKPDLVAQGVNVATVFGIDETRTITGTSAATPLIAGAVALVRQIHPNWTAQDIWEQFTSHANCADFPDNVYGYGEINLMDLIIAEPTDKARNITIFPNPATEIIYFYVLEPSSSNYKIFDLLGQQIYQFSSMDTKTSRQFFMWNGKNNLGKSVASGIYFLSNSDGKISEKFILVRE